MGIIETVLLFTSSSLVGAWVVASTFAMQFIRWVEGDATQYRIAGGRITFVAPSEWQALAA
jgi:hypothetical protein